MRRTSPFAAPRRVVPLAALLACCALAPLVPAHADFTLVSPEEHARALADPAPADDDLQAKGDLGGPLIVVRAPAGIDGAVASPLDIEIGFEPVDGATVDMGSLRIYYVLLFRKDVTKRILEHAEIGADFIRAEGAELPSGEHAFVVEITDSAGRKSRERFEVTVSG